jgi:hypothetical protein
MCSGQRQNSKTTGPLAAKGVQQLSRVRFEKIDDQGLHISVGSDDSGYQVPSTVIVCAGQKSVRDIGRGARSRGGSGARDRRRRYRFGTRREAGDRSGDALGRRALICDSCLSSC